jgi:hypothetical protein
MGINLGFLVNFFIKKWNIPEGISRGLKTKISFLLVLMIALLWENLEHYIELGLFGKNIAYWFQGVEHWSNRLISDNVLVLLGWYIHSKKNKIVWFARIFSAVWIFFHVVVFPHSMFLHMLFEK